MPKTLTPGEIVATNPKIDEADLERVRQSLKKLREVRPKGSRYKLASPTNRRRVRIGEDAETSDLRTVRLGRRQPD